MITVLIYKLDSEEVPVANLKKGSHNFGRGPLLQCEDRRVSRNHGVIEVTDTTVTLASTHHNPCFYQTAISKTITILPKDTPVSLNDGDKFALLADNYWFKVKIQKDDLEEEEVGDEILEGLNDNDTLNNNEQSQTSKREYEGDDDSVETKRTKLNDESSYDNVEDGACNDNANDQGTIKAGPNHKLSDRDAELKAMLFSSDDEKDVDNAVSDPVPHSQPDDNNTNDEHTNVPINNDDSNTNNAHTSVSPNNDDTVGTSTSTTTKPKRDYCIYGAQCYRKNNAHFAEFSHPGDSDYESDPNDDRPVCTYGAACYRTNKDHRKAFKHPRGGQDPNKLVKKPQTTKKKTPKKRTNRKNYEPESSEDDYDMDDPFMADSSSEYEIDSVSEDDTDSDWSGKSEEETKRLVKEAKRFTKGKKKDKDD